MKRYLLIVWGDVEPQPLRGPYKTEAKRIAAARKYREEEGDEHGLYRVDVPEGRNGIARAMGDVRRPRVSSFAGGELDPVEVIVSRIEAAQ